MTLQQDGFKCPRGYDPCKQVGCDCRRKAREAEFRENNISNPVPSSSWHPVLPESEEHREVRESKEAFEKWKREQ